VLEEFVVGVEEESETEGSGREEIGSAGGGKEGICGTGGGV
jgi:hypothetical protein